MVCFIALASGLKFGGKPVEGMFASKNIYLEWEKWLVRSTLQPVGLA